jgi:hypothetical protein
MPLTFRGLVSLVFSALKSQLDFAGERPLARGRCWSQKVQKK